MLRNCAQKHDNTKPLALLRNVFNEAAVIKTKETGTFEAWNIFIWLLRKLVEDFLLLLTSESKSGVL